jgi:hypothetical protein
MGRVARIWSLSDTAVSEANRTLVKWAEELKWLGPPPAGNDAQSMASEES